MTSLCPDIRATSGIDNPNAKKNANPIPKAKHKNPVISSKEPNTKD